MKIRTEDAVKPYGNKHRMAIELGIDPSTVYHWGEYVPESRAWHLEALRLRKELENVRDMFNPDGMFIRLQNYGYKDAIRIIHIIGNSSDEVIDAVSKEPPHIKQHWRGM